MGLPNVIAGEPKPVTTRQAMFRIAIVIAVCTTAILLRTLLHFTNPIFDRWMSVPFFALPFFIIRPLLQLPFWGRVVGCTAATPLLALTVLGLMFQLTCVLAAPYMVTAQTIQFPGFQVRAFHDCGGGGTVACFADVVQEWPLLPGVVVRRTLDAAYAGRPAMVKVIGENAVDIRIPDRRSGRDQVHHLKPHLFF